MTIDNSNGCAPLNYNIESLDCAGISAVPSSGTVAPGLVNFVTLFANTACGFSVGTPSNACRLAITSDDPDTPYIEVAVNLTVTGSPIVATPGMAYASQGPGGSGELFEVDLATGAATVTGNTCSLPVEALVVDGAGRLLGQSGSTLYQVSTRLGGLTDLTPLAPHHSMVEVNGELWGADDSGVWSIDPVTGQRVEVLAATDIKAMAYVEPWLYIGAFEIVLRLDPVGGGTSEYLGFLGLGLNIDDFVTDEFGNLYALARDDLNASHLVSVNKETGVGTLIGPTGASHLASLAFRNPACSETNIGPLPEFVLVEGVPIGGVATETFEISNNAGLGCEDLVWSMSLPCSYVSATPSSGTVPPGGSVTVTVEFDMFGLEPSSYVCNGTLVSNDPDQPSTAIDLIVEMTGQIGPATAGVVYATQGYVGTGELVTIDPGTGAATVVGDTRVGGLPGLAISSQGGIYGVGGANSGTQDFYQIDAATGGVVLVGNTGEGCVQAMAFGPNDVLYCVTNCVNQVLATVNVANGAMTPGPIVPIRMAGLAFDPTDGTLYGSTQGGDNLYTIDIVTGVATQVGALSLSVTIGDIHFDAAGNLFGVVGGGLGPNSYVAIDKTTGAGTPIGLAGVSALTGVAVVPMDLSPVPDTETPLPTAYALHGATPNPFNPLTRISFEIPTAGQRHVFL